MKVRYTVDDAAPDGFSDALRIFRVLSDGVVDRVYMFVKVNRPDLKGSHAETVCVPFEVRKGVSGRGVVFLFILDGLKNLVEQAFS